MGVNNRFLFLKNFLIRMGEIIDDGPIMYLLT